MHLGDNTPRCSACRALLRAAFAAHEGHEVDTQGDSFFMVFSRATQAVAAAVAMQRALVAEAWPEVGPCGTHRPPRGNRSGRRRGTRAGTSSAARASGTPATVGGAAVQGRPPPCRGRPDRRRACGTSARIASGLPRPERIFQLIIPDLPDDFSSSRWIRAGAPATQGGY